jgi:hypothetical protein
MIDNNDTESLFASLDIPFDRTVETTAILNNNSIMNHNDDIEDIASAGMDPLTSTNRSLLYLRLLQHHLVVIFRQSQRTIANINNVGQFDD